MTALVVFFALPARAGQMDWTMRLTLNHVATADADPAAKRKVGVMDISGPAEIEGRNAQAKVLVLYDYANGTGPWQVYMTLTLTDGSLTTYGSGLTVADENGLNSRFEGPLMVVAGTGRYANARGSGTMSGQRAAKVGDDVQIDYEISLKVTE
ncbi:MAG: hypothetical protein HOH66_05785 [Rhodospirillaceae bacterium]|nr:hypothetical protein [Rhodospirillaceae bacterium]